MARPLSPRSPLQRPLGVALLVVVTLTHVWLADELMEDRLGFGAASQAMRRIEVAYVRELAVAPPPKPEVARRQPATRARRAPAKAVPASAPRPAPEPPPAPVVAQVEPLPPAASAPPPDSEPAAPPVAAIEPAPAASADLEPVPALAAAVAASAPTPAAAASAVPFEWPPSTRLSYGLAGNYRGEVQGSATVEWIRVGLRYQVHMEAIVGPPFAPLLVRRVSSEGELGDSGLTPRRFEGEQRVAFRSRRWAMTFEPEQVRLPEGRNAPTLPGVQDEASMFVQLTWLFTTQAHALQVGRTIEMPLALPRRVEVWHYDVIGEETLQMPFAEVATLHVKPRRVARPGGDMTAEMWIAPGLQYLPVRILIRQDAQTFVDLTLQRAPQQSAAPR